ELDPAVLRASDPLVVNEHEAALVLAQLRPGAGSGASMPDAPDELIRAHRGAGIVSVVLTLGARGSLVANEDGVHRVPAAQIDAVDTTAAGDAFIGALALGLARRAALLAAARLASRGGASAATGPGARASYPGIGDPLPEVDDPAGPAG